MIPADKKRCQAEIISYEPFRCGGNPHQVERCKNKPVFIATETKKGKDGKKGSMSLCENCRKIALKKLGKKHFISKKIK